ncbi:hypothetical protein F4861DRAFT_539475 [Xylaria intraflava]|nr:hypothetical protein F4861DRAFT_539475 [Xylaria intraflava]
MDDNNQSNEDQVGPNTPVQYSWSNVGYPQDETQIPEPFVPERVVEANRKRVFLNDIIDIRTKSAHDLAPTVHESFDHGRVMQSFLLNGRRVIKVEIADIDIDHGRPAGTGGFAEYVEGSIKVPKPSLEVEQVVMAHILKEHRDKLDQTNVYAHALHLAQFNLYREPRIESAVEAELEKGFPNSIELEEVRKQHTTHSENPFHELQRDKYANKYRVLDFTGEADIVMVLDSCGKVLVFQLKDVFARLSSGNAQEYVTESFKKYSTLVPVPLPDRVLNTPHWKVWLPRRPDLDFRREDADHRLAKSGVLTFGVKLGKPGLKCRAERILDSKHEYEITKAHRRGRKSLKTDAIGLCGKVSSDLLRALDRELFEDYEDVANMVAQSDNPSSDPRTNAFVLTEVYVNMLSATEDDSGRDQSGLEGGLQARISLGNFTDSSVIFRQLGIMIPTEPGSIMLYRAHELRAGETMYKGQKFVVVNKTDHDLAQWANREGGSENDNQDEKQFGNAQLKAIATNGDIAPRDNNPYEEEMDNAEEYDQSKNERSNADQSMEIQSSDNNDPPNNGQPRER